jgi:hypothetical protein
MNAKSVTTCKILKDLFCLVKLLLITITTILLLWAMLCYFTMIGNWNRLRLGLIRDGLIDEFANRLFIYLVSMLETYGSYHSFRV